jgi:phosphatidate cytidylyltransferase
MTRLISGAVLAAAALAAVLFLPVFALRVLACVVAALATYEYLRLSGSEVSQGHLPTAAVIVSCAVASAQFEPHFEVVFGIVLALVTAGVLFGGWQLPHAASAGFASIYIGVPLGMLAAIQARYGAAATLLVIATVVVSDTAQYYTGRRFGRRPLAPTISPKKTIEGAAGGLVFGTIFVVLVGLRVLPSPGYLPLIVLGLGLVLFGICGDLFESRLKRNAGVKDSSSVIPGHGGVLDRIDALLFAIPAFYAYLRMAAS